MNRIAELRKKNNLSQSELSKRLGIAQNTLSQYENELRIPSSRIVLTLADLFGVTPNYLMGESEPAPAKDHSPHSATKILRETDVDRVNLYLRKGWHLLHIGEDKELHYDGSGYSNIVYSLGWFSDPKSPAAQALPDNYLNEDESEWFIHAHYKMCKDRKTGEEIRVGYDDPNDEPPDIIDYDSMHF